jgi:MerR family transcriptional regulator/heat shock protein HspR
MQQNSPSNEPVYVISVAARLAGLPSWVLRVLDQEGIVVPVRTDSNRRLYSDADIAILGRVRHWTEDRGVNIAGVKVILEMEQTGGEPRPTGEQASRPEPGTALVPRERNGALVAAARPILGATVPTEN